MRIKSVLFILGILALGLGGCLDSPSPLGPSTVLGCLSKSDLVPLAISPFKIPANPHRTSTSCSLPILGCVSGTQVIHSRGQLLALDSACDGVAQSASCTDPCNFNIQMLIGYSTNVSCMASGQPAIDSVCYTKDQVVVTITLPTIPTPIPGGISYQCNSYLVFYEWIAVPASNLPVVFAYH